MQCSAVGRPIEYCRMAVRPATTATRRELRERGGPRRPRCTPTELARSLRACALHMWSVSQKIRACRSASSVAIRRATSSATGRPPGWRAAIAGNVFAAQGPDGAGAVAPRSRRARTRSYARRWNAMESGRAERVERRSRVSPGAQRSATARKATASTTAWYVSAASVRAPAPRAIAASPLARSRAASAKRTAHPPRCA